MSSPMVMTSVLLIECKEAALATFLKDQWPKLETWCGLKPIHMAAEVHNRRTVISMVYDGEFNPEIVPEYIQEVEIFPHIADIHLARVWLLPNHGNGNSRPKITPTVLFGGND